jgi:hypothetical protein
VAEMPNQLDVRLMLAFDPARAADTDRVTGRP